MKFIMNFINLWTERRERRNSEKVAGCLTKVWKKFMIRRIVTTQSICLQCTIDAVSYTHLDVYKRQVGVSA